MCIRDRFNIPFLGSHLSLFCLLMTVVNILNSKFMMQQQDTGANLQMAAMKWMTYLMPIMMSVSYTHLSLPYFGERRVADVQRGGSVRLK